MDYNDTKWETKGTEISGTMVESLDMGELTLLRVIQGSIR